MRMTDTTLIARALKEDRAHADITTNHLIDAKHTATAYISVKEDAVVSGVDIAATVFHMLDKKCRVTILHHDGAFVPKNTRIICVEGKTRALLSGERTALNFLGHLCGVATNTRRFVEAIRPYKAAILDTRKTTPGLRVLEKYAVRCGGGENHRQNLAEMVLIKDNHREIYAESMSLTDAIRHFKKHVRVPVEVEVDTLEQFKNVLPETPDMILLDNMSTTDMRTAVRTIHRLRGKKRPLLEASGGINLTNVREIAQTGVDRISIGSLTHMRHATDVSMEIIQKTC